MEIGYQGIQYFKPVSRIDEYLSPSCFGLQDAVVRGSGLNGTAAGGPHTDDPASGRLGVVYLPGLGFFHHVELRMHVVVQDIFHLHGAEGPKTHMERHMCHLDPHFLNLF